jgi:hypothetical protein
MKIQFTQFNPNAESIVFRSPEDFKRYSKRFFSAIVYQQTDLFLETGGFASSPVLSSGALEQGTSIDGQYYECDCSECDRSDCKGCEIASFLTNRFSHRRLVAQATGGV